MCGTLQRRFIQKYYVNHNDELIGSISCQQDKHVTEMTIIIMQSLPEKYSIKWHWYYFVIFFEATFH